MIDFFVYLTFFIVFALNILFIYIDKFSFSLRMIFHMFSIIFYVIAPFSQFLSKFAVCVGYESISAKSYFYTNCIIIFSILLFEIIYTLLKFNPTQKISIPKLKVSNISKFLLVVNILILLFFLLSIGFNVKLLLIRQKNYSISFGAMAWVILEYFIYYIPSSYFLINLLFSQSKKLTFISFLILLIVRFPTGIARLSVAACYLPVCLVLFFDWSKKSKLLLLSVILFSILVVFPFLNLFRYSTFYDNGSVKIGFGASAFNSLHFDSYQSIAFVIQNKVITYGNQLLGVLFFWVPHTLWINKPISSGAYLARRYYLFDENFDNISLNYIGEGYINFGILGIVFFIVFLAFISKKCDYHFWITNEGDKHTSFAPIYFILISSLFFTLRGALLSAFAYLCGNLAAIMFIEKLYLQGFCKPSLK